MTAAGSARPGAPTAVTGGGSGPIGIPQPRLASATPQVQAALDARLEALRKRAGIPGISAAIVFPDGTRWQGTAGLADVAAGRPVTADTAFPVASVSKTFTAAVILGLVEDGTLSLDASASRTCPACRSIAGSRSASCSTTPAGFATSSSVPAWTTPC